MMKLKNIVKNDKENIVSCDFYPEDSQKAGTLSYNLDTHKMTYTLPEGYEWCKNHVAHARYALEEVAESGEDYKDNMICVWY